MSNIKLKFKGRICTDGRTPEGRKLILEDMSKKISELIKLKVQQAFQRSTQIAAYIGQSPDMESIRMILRSINTEVKSLMPMRISIKVADNLGHWYGMNEPPQELVDLINEIAKDALDKMIGSPEMKEVIINTLRGEI